MDSEAAKQSNSSWFYPPLDLPWPQFIPWGLLILGVLMVMMAGALGHAFVPKTQYGPNSVGWNPQDEAALASQFRLLGIMAFAAGLTERIVQAIRSR
jgi:hypothetical protein